MTADPSAALAAIRAREQAATPGPWRANNGSREIASGNGWFMPLHYVPEAVRPDAEFIAHAREDVRRMADLLERINLWCSDSIYADTQLAGLIRREFDNALGDDS